MEIKHIGRIKCIKKNSLWGIWNFLRAEIIISTHDYFSNVFPGKGQRQINLWHGNGYKVIPERDRVYRGDYSIGTSDIFVPIIANKFGIKKENIWITGLPRNDALFKQTGELEKITKGRNYKKVLFWMPTYRKARINHAGIDGNINEFGLNVFLNSDFEIFDRLLEERNYLLLIKPHPMEDISSISIHKSENIRFMTNETFEEKNLDLYKLLAEVDVLLSDYSSVVIDFLLCDKPIAMICSDISEYGDNRGFVLNPVNEFFPGPIISSAKEFQDYIEDIDQINEEWKGKRKELKHVFHKYVDANSSVRVCEQIFGKIDASNKGAVQ